MSSVNAVLCFVAVLAVIAGLVFLVIAGSKQKKSMASFGGIFLILGAVVFVLSASFQIIPTGYTGVRSTFGQISSQTVPNGFNWKIPFVQQIELVNNKQQDVTFDSEIWSETSERTALYYSGVTVTFQINPEKSAWIFANVSNYKESLMNSGLIASAIKASSKSLEDMEATNRAVIEPLAMENIQKSLDDKYGENVVIVNKVIINNADFEDSYNLAIAEKQKALLESQQQAIINKQNIEKADADAKVALAKANAEAEAKRIQAKADSDVKKIQAEAEAAANKTLEQSISDKILQMMYINRWNGELPDVVGEDSDLLYNLNMGSGETSKNSETGSSAAEAQQ